MKRTWWFLLVLGCLFSLASCGSNEISSNKEPERMFGTVRLTETETTVQESYFRIEADLSSSEFSQNIYDGLAEEWQKYDRLSEEARIFSSHSWGTCYRAFDTWAECEAFLDTSLHNPLEQSAWLESANLSGISLNDERLSGQGHHIEISWYGTIDGKISFVNVHSGYLTDGIRVQMTATFNGDDKELFSTGFAWPKSVTFEIEDFLMQNGNTALLITPTTPDFPSSIEAYFVQDNVLYTFHIVGEQAKGRETLERILTAFSFSE